MKTEKIVLTHPVEGDQSFPIDQANKLVTMPPNNKGQKWSFKENPPSGEETITSSPDVLESAQIQSSTDATNGSSDKGDIGETKEKGNHPKGNKS